jgi:hypothetical protein
MRKLWDWYKAWRVRHVKNYIGKVSFVVSLENTQDKVPLSLLFFMSPSNQRSIEWPSIKGYNMDDIFQRREWAVKAKEWEKGGDLPKEFVPVENDGFEQLLMRIVERRMGVHGQDD